MKKRKVDVVCPLFVTSENVNMAMVRDLIDKELRCSDVRTFILPQGLTHEEVYDLAKEALLGHELQLVKERLETSGQEEEEKEKEGERLEEEGNTGRQEAWYYGLTKVKKNHVVIKAGLSEREKDLEFMVATTDWPAVTGMLAEVGQTFNHLVKKRLDRETQAQEEILRARWGKPQMPKADQASKEEFEWDP